MNIDGAKIIGDLVDRGSHELLVWAIDWLGVDLADIWDDLADSDRDRLVEVGVVREVEAGVECVGAKRWDSWWLSECSAGWPCYTLEITADGMEAIRVKGWHCVGYHGPNGNRQCEEWDETDDDGQFSGLPTIDEWDICGGDNLDDDHSIPCWRQGDCWVTLDRRELEFAILAASGQADHGSEPDWQDVTMIDKVDGESVWAIDDDHGIIEVEIWRGGIAPRDMDRFSTRKRGNVIYAAEAWGYAVAGKDETFETREDILEDIRDDYGEVYDSELDACDALCDRIEDIEDKLPDGVGLFRAGSELSLVDARDIAPGQAALDSYEMSHVDMTDVLRDGWESLLCREGFLSGAVYQTSRGRAFAAGDTAVVIDKQSVRVNGVSIKATPDVLAMCQAALADHSSDTDKILADALEEAGLTLASEVIRKAIQIKQE